MEIESIGFKECSSDDSDAKEELNELKDDTIINTKNGNAQSNEPNNVVDNLVLGITVCKR